MNNNPYSDPLGSATSVIAHTHTPRQETHDFQEVEPQAILQYHQAQWYPGVNPLESAFPYLSLCQWPAEIPVEYQDSSVNQGLSSLLSPIGSSQIMPSHVSNNYGGNARYGVMGMPVKRRTGGRRPKEEEDYALNAEDFEKRMKRRQRNKEAAARCRQRRLDLMNALAGQVDELKRENAEREREIEDLKNEKAELEYLLRSHTCKLNSGFTAPSAPRGLTKRSASIYKPHKTENTKELTLNEIVIKQDPEIQRPSTLSFGDGLPSTPGVPISTPSNGLTPGFSFDGMNLLGQQTGLTPVSNTGLTPLFPVTSSSLDTPMDCSRSLENL